MGVTASCRQCVELNAGETKPRRTKIDLYKLSHDHAQSGRKKIGIYRLSNRCAVGETAVEDDAYT
jgi:hypothetical protein